jgi:hypothetical protein
VSVVLFGVLSYTHAEVFVAGEMGRWVVGVVGVTAGATCGRRGGTDGVDGCSYRAQRRRQHDNTQRRGVERVVEQSSGVVLSNGRKRAFQRREPGGRGRGRAGGALSDGAGVQAVSLWQLAVGCPDGHGRWGQGSLHRGGEGTNSQPQRLVSREEVPHAPKWLRRQAAPWSNTLALHVAHGRPLAGDLCG